MTGRLPRDVNTIDQPMKVAPKTEPLRDVSPSFSRTFPPHSLTLLRVTATPAEGTAPWEVRIECESHHDAEALADRLEAEGYGVLRRFRYVIAGTATREEAEALAARLHGEVEPSSAYVWESAPQNPFVVFGGLGGAGTPL